MRLIKLICCLLFTAFIASCGGGGSSSGGSSSNDNSSSEFDGFYVGSGTLTTTNDGQSFTDPFEISITIGNGSVTIIAHLISGQAALNPDGRSYTVTAVSSSTSGTTTCTTTSVFVGTISGNQTTGTVSGGTTCSDGALSIVSSDSGNFTATK